MEGVCKDELQVERVENLTEGEFDENLVNEARGSSESENSDKDTRETENTETTSDLLTETEAKKLSKSKPKSFRKIDEKKRKLRTSKDIYDRLKWDIESIEINFEPLSLSSIYIGYKDRFLGMCEIPYEDFVPIEGQGEIPFHRVYYFRTGGPPKDPFVGQNGEVKVREDNLPPGTVFLWDRESRTDLIFQSGNS